MGSVRDVVLRVCETMDIPVVLEAPKTESYPSWDGVSGPLEWGRVLASSSALCIVTLSLS
jgi:hypothetical protein